MTPLTIHGKAIDFPHGWHDLTWGQFLAITNIDYTDKRDSEIRIEVVSILTGQTLDYWKASTDIETYAAISSTIDWVFSTNFEEVISGMQDRPFIRVNYEGEQYTMPSDVGTLPVALFEDAKFILQDYFAILKEAQEEPEKVNHKALFRNIENIFKIYFQYVKDGEYSYRKAQEIDISGLPLVVVIRWKDFFLAGLIGFLNSTQKDSRKSSRRRKRS